MNNKLLISLFTLSTAVTGFSASKDNSNNLDEVLKISQRDDKLYNIVCKDGSVELMVSIDDLESDNVCGSKKTVELPLSAKSGDLYMSGDGCVDYFDTFFDPSKYRVQFYNFSVEVGTFYEFRNCNYNLTIHGIKGWQYAVQAITAEYSGILTTAKGHIDSQVAIPNKGSVTFSQSVKDVNPAATSKSFDIIPASERVWSECGKGIYHASSDIYFGPVESGFSSSVNLFALEAKNYKLTWKKCN